MFLEFSFLFPASLVVIAQLVILLPLIMGLNADKRIPEGASESKAKEAINSAILCKLLIIPFVLISAVANYSGISDYVNKYQASVAREAEKVAVAPLLSVAKSRPFDQVCTRNGYLATDKTLESDKIACAQSGDFRVIHYGPLSPESVVFFKVVGPLAVLQVNAPSWMGFGLNENLATLAELKDAFGVAP